MPSRVEATIIESYVLKRLVQTAFFKSKGEQHHGCTLNLPIQFTDSILGGQFLKQHINTNCDLKHPQNPNTKKLK